MRQTIPTSFKLAQNYPNPFNPVTTIEYNVANSGFVTLEVYDVMGRLVKTLVDNQWTVAGQTSGYSVNGMVLMIEVREYQRVYIFTDYKVAQ